MDWHESCFYQKTILQGKDSLGYAPDIADSILKEDEIDFLDT